jgi:hypothetical protein
MYRVTYLGGELVKRSSLHDVDSELVVGVNSGKSTRNYIT